MTNAGPATNDFEPSYRSGIAARLAGIPVETLRVWERRYRVVGPRLSLHRHRLYSAEDVSRLTLMKQLVTLGSPIGSIASLSLAELRDMRSAANAASQGVFAGAARAVPQIRVVLVGETLTARTARDCALHSTLELVATCANTADAVAALRGVAADVLVMEMPTLHAAALATVDTLLHVIGARHAVIEYRFGQAAVVSALRERGHKVVRAPLERDALERLCREAFSAAAPATASGSSPLPLEVIPERRFDDASLARLAQSLTTLYCECPHHVVELLLSLGTFERYSAECANRGPADAVLHRYLQHVAASARVLFEDALFRIARAEGLPLPVDIGNARRSLEQGRRADVPS